MSANPAAHRLGHRAAFFRCFGLATGVAQSQPFHQSFQRIGLLPLGSGLVLDPRSNHTFHLYQRRGKLVQHPLARCFRLGVLCHPVRIGQMDWSQIRRHHCRRTIARAEELGHGHLDGQPLPTPIGFSLPGFLFRLPKPVQQLADLVLWTWGQKTRDAGLRTYSWS